MYPDRTVGVLLETISLKCALLNVCVCYEQGTLKCLQDYQPGLDDLSNYISDGCFEEIIDMGKSNGDPNIERFFRELQNLVTRHSLFCSDADKQPSFTYTY